MTPEETRILLGEVAIIDSRKMSTETANVWQQLLHGFTLAECREALATFRRNRPDDWVNPGHLVQIMNRAPSWDQVRKCGHAIPLGAYCHDCSHPSNCVMCLTPAPVEEDPDW